MTQLGIFLLFVGFAIMLWAPRNWQIAGFFALVFAAMLIHANGYKDEVH